MPTPFLRTSRVEFQRSLSTLEGIDVKAAAYTHALRMYRASILKNLTATEAGQLINSWELSSRKIAAGNNHERPLAVIKG